MEDMTPEEMGEIQFAVVHWLNETVKYKDGMDIGNYLFDGCLLIKLLNMIEDGQFKRYHEHPTTEAQVNGNVLAIAQVSYKLGVPFDCLMTVSDAKMRKHFVIYRYLLCLMNIGHLLRKWSIPLSLLQSATAVQKYMDISLDLTLPNYEELSRFQSPSMCDNRALRSLLRESFPHWILTHELLRDIRGEVSLRSLPLLQIERDTHHFPPAVLGLLTRRDSLLSFDPQLGSQRNSLVPSLTPTPSNGSKFVKIVDPPADSFPKASQPSPPRTSSPDVHRDSASLECVSVVESSDPTPPAAVTLSFHADDTAVDATAAADTTLPDAAANANPGATVPDERVAESKESAGSESEENPETKSKEGPVPSLADALDELRRSIDLGSEMPVDPSPDALDDSPEERGDIAFRLKLIRNSIDGGLSQSDKAASTSFESGEPKSTVTSKPPMESTAAVAVVAPAAAVPSADPDELSPVPPLKFPFSDRRSGAGNPPNGPGTTAAVAPKRTVDFKPSPKEEPEDPGVVYVVCGCTTCARTNHSCCCIV